MTTVAIIGAGPLGRWLALAAARAGYRVFLEDVMPSNLHHAQEFLRQQLTPLNVHAEVSRRGMTSVVPNEPQKGGWALTPEADQEAAVLKGHDFSRADEAGKTSGALAPEGSLPETSGRTASPQGEISFVSTVEDAVREADLVIDCVPDELESKLEILWLLDRMAPPKTVIATPTTNLSIVDLAACTYRPEKCIAIAADPRALTDQRPGSTIELRTTPRTTPETATLVEQFWTRLGFHPAAEPAAVPAEN